MTIVRNEAPAWSDDEGWEVDPSPLLSIGGRNAALEEQFHQIAAVLLPSDTTIAVLDEGSAELRLFSRDGSHLATIGGEGDGPGEFRGGLSAVVAGDSIVVFDAAANRLTLFDHEARFIGDRRVALEVEIEAMLSQYSLIGVWPDHGYVLQKTSSRGRTNLPEPTEWWDSGPNLLLAFDGTIDRMAGGESGMEMWGSPGQSGFVRWGAMTRADVHGSRLFTGDGRGAGVQVHAPTGDRVRSIRRPTDPLTADDADAVVRREATRIVDAGEAPAAALESLEEQLATQPRRQLLPTFDDLRVDTSGHIWTRRYRPRMGGRIWSEEAPEWDVFTPEGRWLGSVPLPEGFEPHVIADSRMAGIWTDDLGTEQVRIYRLLRD